MIELASVGYRVIATKGDPVQGRKTGLCKRDAQGRVPSVPDRRKVVDKGPRPHVPPRRWFRIARGTEKQCRMIEALLFACYCYLTI